LPLHPPLFGLTHQSTHTRLHCLLFVLASRHYMEADLLFSGVQYSTYLHTHLDITSHLHMHPSSISSNLPFFFVFVVWDGMVWGVRARQGQRQAYQESSGLHFWSVALHRITPFSLLLLFLAHYVLPVRVIYCIMLVLVLVLG
jgi:hypothetical protein